MYKLAVVLLLVCSTFCSHASPVTDKSSSNVPALPESSTPNGKSVPDPVVPTDTGKANAKDLPRPSEGITPVQPTSSAADKFGNKTTTSEKPTEPTKSTTIPTTTITTTTTTSTTQKPTTHSPTEPPTTHPTPQPTSQPTTSHPPSTLTPPTTAHPPTPSSGGFSLISFLGGMILGLGLLAIGYVVFKFYQTRRDSSYRTL